MLAVVIAQGRAPGVKMNKAPSLSLRSSWYKENGEKTARW